MIYTIKKRGTMVPLFFIVKPCYIASGSPFSKS